MLACWDDRPKIVTATASVVAVGLAVTVCVQTMLLLGRGWSVDFGSMPDWFAAVGAVGALVIAGGLWRHEVRARRIDEANGRLSDKRVETQELRLRKVD